MRLYVVDKHKDSGLYYVHQNGYPQIPCFGTFTKSRNEAYKTAIAYSGFTKYEEYQKARRNSK